jgi:hypothetical protein
MKVQRADGSEALFPLGRSFASFDVGEKRTLKIAAGDKLLLQSNWRKKFINGELVEVRLFKVIPFCWPMAGSFRPKIIARSLTATPSRRTPPRARPWMKFWSSRRRVRCRRSISSNFTSAFRAGVNAARCSLMIPRLLRSHVTRSNARLAAVEVVPDLPQRNMIQIILQRGHRFLKNFRQHPAQSQSLSPDTNNQPIEPSRYEHQHQSTRRISV